MAKLQSEKNEALARTAKLKNFIEELKNAQDTISEWNDDLWLSLVKDVTVMRTGNLVFHFMSGEDITIKI